MSARKIGGGCHCGAIRFMATVDLSAPTLRCNCSICRKSRAWIAPISADNFSLCDGSEALTEYRFGAEVIAHCFCPRCGVKTHGRIKGEGGADAYVAVSVQCLDLFPEELDALPRACVDGLNDRHDVEPEIAAYM